MVRFVRSPYFCVIVAGLKRSRTAEANRLQEWRVVVSHSYAQGDEGDEGSEGRRRGTKEGDEEGHEGHEGEVSGIALCRGTDVSASVYTCTAAVLRVQCVVGRRRLLGIP